MVITARENLGGYDRLPSSASSSTALDVVLIAGLLAGGANGVHKIIGVFSDSTRRKAKG